MDAQHGTWALLIAFVATLFRRFFGEAVPLIAGAVVNDGAVAPATASETAVTPPKCDAPTSNATNSTSYDFHESWYTCTGSTYTCWTLSALFLFLWIVARWNVSYCLIMQEKVKKLLQRRAWYKAQIGDNIIRTRKEQRWEVHEEGETYWRSQVRRKPTPLQRVPTKVLPNAVIAPIPYSWLDQCLWRVCVAYGGNFRAALFLVSAFFGIGGMFVEFDTEIHHRSSGTLWSRVKQGAWGSAETFSADMLRGLAVQWVFANSMWLIGVGVVSLGAFVSSLCCCDNRMERAERRLESVEAQQRAAAGDHDDEDLDSDYDEDDTRDKELRFYGGELTTDQRQRLKRVQTVVPTLPRQRSVRGLDSAAACELRRSESFSNAHRRRDVRDPTESRYRPDVYGRPLPRSATPQPVPSPHLPGWKRMLTPEVIKSSDPSAVGGRAPSAPPLEGASDA